MKFPASASAQRQLLSSGLRATLSESTTSSSSFSSCGISTARPVFLAHTTLPTTQRRFKTTTARTKRALNIAPHFSFSAPQQAESDVIIFNPPSAAPSVFHTPFKFLPPSDPRRAEGLATFISEEGTEAEANPALLPEVPLDRNSWATRGEPQYNVSFEEAMEIKRLRDEDPYTWTVHKLAKKFGCSPRFVVQCAPAKKEYREEQDKQLEAVKMKWGQKKLKARADKEKRKVLLFNNML
jgi:hypothetical protein